MIVLFATFKLPTLALPVTANDVNVPTEVMFRCAFVVSVPINKLAPIVPLFAYTLLAVIFPVTVKSTSVPTLVILG